MGKAKSKKAICFAFALNKTKFSHQKLALCSLKNKPFLLQEKPKTEKEKALYKKYDESFNTRIKLMDLMTSESTYSEDSESNVWEKLLSKGLSDQLSNKSKTFKDNTRNNEVFEGF